MPQPRRPRTHTAAVAVEPDARAIRIQAIHAVRAALDRLHRAAAVRDHLAAALVVVEQPNKPFGEGR